MKDYTWGLTPNRIGKEFCRVIGSFSPTGTWWVFDTILVAASGRAQYRDHGTGVLPASELDLDILSRDGRGLGLRQKSMAYLY